MLYDSCNTVLLLPRTELTEFFFLIEAIYLHSDMYLFFKFRLNRTFRRLIRSLLRASDQRARVPARSLRRQTLVM